MLSVTIVQSPLVWEDPAANRSLFDQKLNTLQQDTDIILLPETFTTGFSMNAEAIVEPMNGPTLEWMKLKAAHFDAAVGGSFFVEENGAYCNRFIWVFPNGAFQYYDKHHLFTLARENEAYKAGQERLIVEWKGWRIMPLVCYDLRFPEWSRNNLDYDLLIYVANWPVMRNNAWKTLLEARAIENQSYTVGVNRVGTDGKGYYYSGDSSVVDYAGNVHLRVSDVEGVFTVKLDYEAQKVFRTKLPFLPDQDKFQFV